MQHSFVSTDQEFLSPQLLHQLDGENEYATTSLTYDLIPSLIHAHTPQLNLGTCLLNQLPMKPI